MSWSGVDFVTLCYFRKIQVWLNDMHSKTVVGGYPYICLVTAISSMTLWRALAFLRAGPAMLRPVHSRKRWIDSPFHTPTLSLRAAQIRQPRWGAWARAGARRVRGRDASPQHAATSALPRRTPTRVRQQRAGSLPRGAQDVVAHGPPAPAHVHDAPARPLPLAQL